MTRNAISDIINVLGMKPYITLRIAFECFLIYIIYGLLHFMKGCRLSDESLSPYFYWRMRSIHGGYTERRST